MIYVIICKASWERTQGVLNQYFSFWSEKLIQVLTLSHISSEINLCMHSQDQGEMYFNHHLCAFWSKTVTN